jgi:hypothetical protein
MTLLPPSNNDSQQPIKSQLAGTKLIFTSIVVSYIYIYYFQVLKNVNQQYQQLVIFFFHHNHHHHHHHHHYQSQQQMN